LDRLGLKKVRFSVNLAIVGMEDLCKELFQQYFYRTALHSCQNNNVHEYLVIHQNIPFKINLILAKSFDQLIGERAKLKSLDVLIVCINIYNTKSINQYTLTSFNQLTQQYKFQGLTVLAGVDSYYLEKGVPSEYFRISRLNLIKKTNQLNFIYYFEIQNKNGDINAILEQVLNDILQRFQTSSPELLNRAKSYGQELLKEKSIHNS
jgi:hypothetical protein